MSIAAQLEQNLRDRCARNLDRTNVVLVELIRAPINSVSGQLAGGITVDAWQDNGTMFTSTARSLAPYSLFVDKGTGVYGPSGTRIYPRQAKALTFYWQRVGGVVSFRSVAGSPAQNFFSEPMGRNVQSALVTAWGP